MGKNCNCGKKRNRGEVTFRNARNEKGEASATGVKGNHRTSRIEMLKMLWEKSKTENAGKPDSADKEEPENGQTPEK